MGRGRKQSRSFVAGLVFEAADPATCMQYIVFFSFLLDSANTAISLYYEITVALVTFNPARLSL